MRHWKKALLASVVAGTVLTGCGTPEQTTKSSTVGVNRQQTFSVSSAAIMSGMSLFTSWSCRAMVLVEMTTRSPF